MDKVSKFLRRLTREERERVTEAVTAIVRGEVRGYDRKKLKGHANIYRIRLGDIRIVYLELAGERQILTIERRSEQTYRDF